MDELLEMFLAGQREFTARVHAVGVNRWTARTPDTDWSVADLVNHLVDEHLWAPSILRGLDLDAAGEVVDNVRSSQPVGDVNLAALWDEAATGSAEAIRADGILDRDVEVSRGAVPARQYLSEMTFDLALHSWDLGRATGYSLQVSNKLAEFVLDNLKTPDDLAATGLFAAPVRIDDGACALDRLLGATGRDPGWVSAA